MSRSGLRACWKYSRAASGEVKFLRDAVDPLAPLIHSPFAVCPKAASEVLGFLAQGWGQPYGHILAGFYGRPRERVN